MIAKQKNYDHLYHNQEIKVFETEEDFGRYLCTSDDFFGDGITIDDLDIIINDCIMKSLAQYP
jgi:hypothetical protein